jgi:hypothetical protein
MSRARNESTRPSPVVACAVDGAPPAAAMPHGRYGERTSGPRPTLSLGGPNAPRESGSDRGYLAGRKETWIWTATPGAVKPSTSLVL